MKSPGHRVVAAGCAIGLVALAIFHAPWGGRGHADGDASFDQPLDREAFAAPPWSLAPLIRWWWPGGDVDPGEIDRELAAIAGAGFSGVELQSFAVGLPPTAPEDVFNHGTAPWLDHVVRAVDAAGALGLTVDLTLGSSWPSGGDHIDDRSSLQQLTVTGQFVVGPTHLEQALPAPTKPLYYHLAESLLFLPDTFAADKMVPAAVIAVRVDPNQTQDYEPGKSTLAGLPDLPATIYLDPASATYLSDRLAPDGRLVWDVPEGSWALFTFYGGPTGSRPFYGADPEGGLVLDHLSLEATHRHLDEFGGALESRLAPWFGTALRSVFVDSLELRSELFWTEDLFQEFLNRRGYRLEPFLPILNEPFQHDAYMRKVYPNAPPGFEMRILGPRVRYDYDRTVSELMSERFFAPIREWAEARGLTTRVQAHGGPVDLLSAYAEAHIPETEGLFAGGRGAFLKIASSAAHLNDKPIVSSEVFAFRLPYESASPTAMLAQANQHLAAGANQLVLHGFPYVRDEGFEWPGWMPFDSPYLPGKELIGRFGTRLNDRNPFWTIVPELNRYLSRAQLVGRAGEPRSDVAVLFEASNYPDDPAFEPEVHGVLQGSGYDYDRVNARELMRGSVLDETLHIGRQRYQALVLADVSRMPLEVAHKILELAEGGLPVAFVGDVPSETPGYLNFMENDEALASALESLFGRSRADVVQEEKTVSGSVAFVRQPARLPEVLAGDLRVAPGLIWGEKGISLRYVHRQAGAADYYFIHNSNASILDVEVSFPNLPERVPEIWDLWTGVVEPAIVYTREENRSRVQLHFGPHAAVVVGFDRIGNEPHLETTNLTAVRRSADGLLTAVVDHPGDYTVVFGGGILDEVAVPGPELPPIELSSWDVSSLVRHPDGTETPVGASGIALADLHAIFGEFGPVTTYTTVVDVSGVDPAYLSPEVGLVLDLGEVHDVAEVTVNGAFVGRLLTFPYTLEVTDLVGSGPNRITVTVTTDPTAAPCGLLGPAQLAPIYKATLSLPRPLPMTVNVVPPNFPDNTNEDMLAAIGRATSLVDHVSFQWFWRTPPNEANPEGGDAVECEQVATWVEAARMRGLGVTLQFQTFFTQVAGDYALGGIGPGSMPVVQVATPLMPFETATFAEPAVRAGFLDQLACLASLEPDYLVLGPELNFVYVFDRAEWETFLPVYREGYRLVKALSPKTQVGISYQYDGMLRDRVVHQDDWGYIGTVGPADFIALTSYYGFSEERFLEFPEPFLIPDDYYRPIREVLGEETPIIFSEIGWSSFFASGEVTQAEFVKRMPILLRDVRPDHVTWALLHDVSYFEGPGQSLNQSGLLDRTGNPKPAWESALRLKDEGVFVEVVPRLFAPAPMPFSITAVPPNFPTEPITTDSGFAAIATASEVSTHVSFQFSWRDQVTGQTWECDDIRPFMAEAQRRGLGITLQFNTYTPVLSSDPDADPAIVFSNPIHPPVPPFEGEDDMGSIGADDIRQAYLDQIACIAATRPDYLVLGPEINFLLIFRPREFGEFASVFREAYDLVKNVSPETQLGTSIQYEVLVQEIEEGGTGEWMSELGAKDFIGLTTYFASSDERRAKFPNALDIPDDYYHRARALFGDDVPIVFTEVAWSTFYSGGDENQVLFLNRLPALLQGVRPVNVIWGLQHDILDYYSGEIRPLNWIGLRRLDGEPKPGWQQVLQLRALGLYRSPSTPSGL